MTRWIESDGARPRGPRALAIAWFTVIVRPRAFFRAVITPGDQAAGLVFAMAVVAIEELVRVSTVPGALTLYAGSPMLSVAFHLGLAALLIVPAALHLGAAVQTIVFVAFAPNRGGISETVQVMAYATAPCILAGVPIPTIRVAVTASGYALLVVGFSERHDLTLPVSAVLSSPIGVLVFGYGFRGFTSAAALIPRLT